MATPDRGLGTAPQIPPEEFRRVLGHFPTGVAVVTAQTPNGPVGMAANSFTSVSLDPPLVLFCAARSSDTWPLIRQSGAFCANFLGRGHESLARQFAAKGSDRFDGVGHAAGATGAPVLDEAIAYVDCVIEAEHDGGDHVIAVGRVRDLGAKQAADPIVFFRGSYAGLGRM